MNSAGGLRLEAPAGRLYVRGRSDTENTHGLIIVLESGLVGCFAD